MDSLFDSLTRLTWAPNGWTLLVWLDYALILATTPSILLSRRGQPHSAISWILILCLLPYIGLLLWWAIGRRHLKRECRRRRRASETLSSTLTRLRESLPTAPETDWDVLPIQRLPADEAPWVFPPTTGNRVRLLVDAENAYPAMERAIREARHHLHVMFYIWNNDATGQRFRDLLVERARDGVSVRLLCDAMGSPAVRGRMMDSLRASGGRVEEFHPTHLFSRRPRLNFRNHRKILVADDSVGFVGGINIGDEYTGRWHDTAVELRGPVVDQLQEVFFDDWYYVTGEEVAGREYLGRWHEPMPPAVADDVTDATCGIVASGPHTEHNIIHDALFIAITQAQQRIYIATPYFVPERSILTALRTAVFRGVDVQIIVPAESDSRLVQWASRSYYPQLLAAGIRVFEYAPGVMHAKTAVLDDDASVVGSANMDTRSFKLNFEINCFVRSRPFCRRLADLFERDRQQSREVTAADLESRGKAALLVESLAHLLSPLL